MFYVIVKCLLHARSFFAFSEIGRSLFKEANKFRFNLNAKIPNKNFKSIQLFNLRFKHFYVNLDRCRVQKKR